MTGNYILEDGQPKLEPDIRKWGAWFEDADRHIGKTEGENYVVSTVFLGLDHSFADGPPLLFETMVFRRGGWDGTSDEGMIEQDMARYSTLEEATAGHEAMVAKWDKALSTPESAA